jgi:23S rRNA pseudouridine1911/1915/1917 synthase
MLEYKAQPAEAGRRLDILVTSLYPQFSRSALEMLFDKDMVTVNGKAAKASYSVRPDDVIQVDETYLTKEPEAIELPIIYEDKDVLVIDKPAGLLTHSKGALNLEPTVASFIKSKITDKEMTGNRAGIVHRLDRGTSGVMITTKNQPALHWLQKQFSQRKVKKTYRAIAEGVLEPAEAIIDAPIARNPKKPQTFKVLALGRPAITQYKVLRQFKKDAKNYSELELKPQTGRTHQLRVHLAYIGHPVVGDSVYGHSEPPILLHAESLELTLPSRERKTFHAQLPAGFKEFIGND